MRALPATDIINFLNFQEDFIDFIPLSDEVEYTSTNLFVGTKYSSKQKFNITQDKTTDPYTWARLCIEKFIGKNPYVLIPGRIFDAHGTRHGRGGGWYDRFLSKLPKHWVRIGITTDGCFTAQKLPRKTHDEPIDYVLVFNPQSTCWDFYQTDARMIYKSEQKYLVRD